MSKLDSRVVAQTDSRIVRQPVNLSLRSGELTIREGLFWEGGGGGGGGGWSSAQGEMYAW